jgi:hypothetical protein
MPTPTYTPLATVTLASATGTVTFSNIPATYRDLILVLNYTSTAGNTFGGSLRFNGDTGSNYSDVYMLGDGSSASSGTDAGTKQDIAFVSNVRGNTIVNIMDYSATDKHKTSLARFNTSNVYAIARAYRWANTAAITSMTIFNSSSSVPSETFSVGSTFNLYGVIA